MDAIAKQHGFGDMLIEYFRLKLVYLEMDDASIDKYFFRAEHL